MRDGVLEKQFPASDAHSVIAPKRIAQAPDGRDGFFHGNFPFHLGFQEVFS
jgi:hypothetical protein